MRRLLLSALADLGGDPDVDALVDVLCSQEFPEESAAGVTRVVLAVLERRATCAR